MARSPLILALAASLLIILSTINILHRTPSRNGQHPLDLPVVQNIVSTNSATDSEDGLEGTSLAGGDTYLLGVGKGDITGPVAEINFMGYADPNQLGSGVRQRLYSRAFIIGSTEVPEDRFVYLVLDTQSGDTAVRYGILTALQDKGGEYAKLYGNQNVAVTGTHSHSGPGAWLNYLLPQITSRGFHKPSYQAIVDGAVASIVKAHEGLSEGKLSVGSVDVVDANVNRSPYAYLANPAEERERYGDDVDKSMTVLRFTHSTEEGGKDVGILNWFPVHGTSMLGNNTLVTGDNKGVAASLFEKSTDSADFVAGFSQANVGDTSPNVLGAYCEYGDEAGQLCDFKTSLCGNKSQPCHGRGPYWGRDDAGTASNFEIGRRQFQAARELFDNATAAAWTPVKGQVVRGLHHFVDFSTHSFALPNGTVVHTCPAALGYSFAAGTTDGPGAFDFKQAPDDPHASPFWRTIGNRVATPNDTQKACHGDKIILLDVGESSSPYEWSPNIVDVQLLRVGQLFVIVSPGEATTMAGRRWKEAVHDAAETALVAQSQQGDGAHETPIVVLGGPANTYTHYIATREEYSIQRYEGASTLYGPWTLDAYIQLTRDYLPDLFAPSTPRHLPPTSIRGPQPPIQINDSLSFITPVIIDRAPLFKNFGATKADVRAFYKQGETVTATFVGASPRNDLRLEGTFASVERFDYGEKVWRRVRGDGDWSLVYEWKRTSTVAGTSEVSVSWETGWETGAWRAEGSVGLDDAHGDLLLRGDDGDELKGLYRLRYYGDAKALGGNITPFEGVSGEFKIV
ncbi:hypothetical protein B0A55_00245 [Friedmanniomyces simplex]|uniref:Neutral ceramidase n=1 Tax=Friedmanniomyces simplex TaxID=329884 RepID=A0A4U0Y6M7_9PEZI|nr:hypothetical protein B0A55_00245 [Friedmanniomyces simplex]